MPKCQFIDPKEARKPGEIVFKPIPLNQYNKSMKEEQAIYSNDDLLRIYRDMQIIREFETMLQKIKTTGEYNGIPYNHPGPAHLSIGQEAAAVGMAYVLTIDDMIFGSHRSHGEILAKGLSAIHQLSEKDLTEIMESFFDGRILRIVEKNYQGDVKGLAIRFLLYGTLAEIFARETGFNKGLGGSMHAFFTPFGVYPNNAIVGGSGDISVGAALFKRVNRKKGIVVANIGDASAACGPVWEGISFAAMDQFNELWEGPYKGGLPILFNFMNNQYRFSGHSPSDASSYRSKEEIEAWQASDSIIAFGTDLIVNGICGETDLEQVKTSITESIMDIMRLSIDDEVSPHMDLIAQPELIGSMMFSNEPTDKMEDREPETRHPLAENPRVQQIARKERFALDADGKPFSKIKTYQLRDGLFEAIVDRFYKDPTLVAYGEENRDWGGAFAVYRGLTEALPYNRLFNSPIAEGAIVGTAIGYGMAGGRVIAEIMYCDFLGRAGDEVFNQLPKWQAMSGNLIKMPVVIRVSVGSKYGAQHSQDWSSLVAHIPGLKVVFPATPYDAKGLMNSALQGTDPVIFFESQRIYDIGELFHEGGVPEEYYEIALGEPDIKRTGKDLTILSIGATLYNAIKAADTLEEKYGISTEIIDARSLVPFNYDKVIESVKKTGKILLTSDASTRGSFLKEMAQTITELAFDELDAPPVVVGSRNWIIPAHELEDYLFPQPEWIIDAIHERIVPLKGHQVSTNFTTAEQARRNRAGV